MVSNVAFDDAIISTWQSVLQQNRLDDPFFTYFWQKDWFETIGKDWEPYMLLVDDTVLFPFAKQDQNLILAGGKEISDYQDCIGNPIEKLRAWKEVLVYLKEQGIKELVLDNIPQNSPTLAFFQQRQTEKSLAVTITQDDTTPKMLLPGSWEEYLKSLDRDDRHELERKVRKFEREHTNYSIKRSEDTVHDGFKFMELMKHNEYKKQFLESGNEVFFTKLFATFSNTIALYFLYVEDTAVASTFSFVTKDTVLLYNSAFLASEHSNAGFYLKTKTIEFAINNTMKEYNFLQGNERYKYELGGKDFFVYTIAVSL